MAKLTSKERLLRTIRLQDVDRVAISPRYYDYLMGICGCRCVHHHLQMARQYDHDPMINYTPPQNNYLLQHVGPFNDLQNVKVNIEITDAGDKLTVKRQFDTPAGAISDTRLITRPGDASGFEHIVEPLVKDRADLDKVSHLLPPAEQAYIGEIPLLQEAIGDIGLLVVKATQGVDQFLMDALGMESALMMYHDDRELLEQTLRLFQDYHRAILKRVLEQGIELIFEPWYNCGLGVGWAPEQYRQMVLPMIKENVELIHSYGALVDYYDDGKMDGILEDLASVGVDVAETLSPPPLGDIDLASAKKRVGDKMCLKGHIDQINLICFGTVQQIREAVRKAIEIAAPGSGFILGTSDSIRPESPPENIKAYFDAAHEFGAVK